MSLRHRILFAAVLVVLAFPVFAATGAPQMVLGESWQYSEREGYSGLELRAQRSAVVSVSGATVRMRLDVVPRSGETQSEEQRFAPAGTLAEGRLSDRVRGSFQPELQLLPFPLEQGKAWSQTARCTDAATGANRTVTVRGKVIGWETVRVPAGEFRALKVERVMSLGDQDTFRTETRRTEYEWYVPELKSAVRIEVWEEYRDSTLPRIQSYLLRDKRYFDLVSYEPRRN
jgi:hypothetical protein